MCLNEAIFCVILLIFIQTFSVSTEDQNIISYWTDKGLGKYSKTKVIEEQYNQGLHWLPAEEIRCVFDDI